MRAFFFSLALLAAAALASPVTAQEAKPNTLTPKEIADGWILLFDGETTFGWKIVDGQPKVVNDALVLGGEKNAVDLTSRFPHSELSFEYKNKKGMQSRLIYHDDTERLGSFIFPDTEGEWRPAKMKWIDKRVDIESIGYKSEREPWGSSTQISFRQLGGELQLRNIKLKPLNTKSIFNGKDLTGWKEIPEKKSKFTVNDKGDLNIKDGPGDLQTTGEWDDFVLQLDVFSNGKHLNSGVFFRCQPGQFWSGYEAQIRNQWLGDDRTKAVDYGTGGIYNRQPARKVVSSDKEWFTMTVVAHGSHLATWVNGIQVTDFTDTRKPDASARKGLKVDKGPISLQGHDPTTDLSFRNIRIEAMPRIEPPKK
jgi:hypothetical protein